MDPFVHPFIYDVLHGVSKVKWELVQVIFPGLGWHRNLVLVKLLLFVQRHLSQALLHALRWCLDKVLIFWHCLVVSSWRLVFHWRPILFDVFNLLLLVIGDWVIPFAKFRAELISSCKLCRLEDRIPQVSGMPLLLRHAKVFYIYRPKNFQKVWIFKVSQSSIIVIIFSQDNHGRLQS